MFAPERRLKSLRPTDVVRSLHLLQLFFKYPARMMPEACWWLPHGLVEFWLPSLSSVSSSLHFFSPNDIPTSWWCESMSRSLLAYNSMCTCHLCGWQLLHSVASLVNDLTEGVQAYAEQIYLRTGVGVNLVRACPCLWYLPLRWLLEPVVRSTCHWACPYALSHIISLPLCGTAGFSCLLALSP